MSAAARKQIDAARLKADLASAAVELLSAQCAADRVRLQYSPQEIALFGEPQTLRRAFDSVEAIRNFFSQIETQFKHRENSDSEKR